MATQYKCVCLESSRTPSKCRGSINPLLGKCNQILVLIAIEKRGPRSRLPQSSLRYVLGELNLGET